MPGLRYEIPFNGPSCEIPGADERWKRCPERPCLGEALLKRSLA